ncbi:MAG: aldehyde dehydrogenase family protein [Bdellovibrionales bacterium]
MKLNHIELPKEKIILENFVNGEWKSATGTEFKIDSPYFGKTIGLSRNSTIEDVEIAVKAAHSAYKSWSKKPMKERAQVLFKFRQNLIDRSEEIAQIISLENGKTLSESRAGIAKGVEVLEYALSLQNIDQGGKMEVSRGVFCEYRRRSLGVVLSITPFNFPAMVPMWTIPIAIALGNSYVWKPSEKTPLTSKWITQSFSDAGLPAGVLTVVQGGRESTEALIDHPLIKAVGFVGSSKVAKAVYERSAKNAKRALCMGGAKNHIVLLPDADSGITGVGISNSFTGCAGQRCMAASVLLAVGNVDNQIAAIKKTAESTTQGDKMGAIITEEQVDFLHTALDRAVAEGATLILDGRKSEKPSDYKDGFWLGPTILDNVKPNSQAACDELFGPILSIVRVDNITEAMRIENSNPYGNACSVFTSSGPLAEEVLSQATAGMLGVNIGVPVPREPFSFGGIFDSKYGHGEITGPGSLDFWSDQVKLTTKWEKQNDETWMS